MSAYTSARITKSAAKSLIVKAIMDDKLDDTGLGLVLDEMFQGRLLSFNVVPDGCENDEAELLQGI